MEIILRPVVRRRVLDSMVYSGLDWLVVVSGWLLVLGSGCSIRAESLFPQSLRFK